MKIPILLVTGFLGSGKTTFLRRLAENHPDWHLVFLVNEFAQTSVDGDTLAAAGTPTQSVVGGSLFCNCKAAEFVRVLNETVIPRHQQSPLDAVVIETSGIADPEAIGKIMRDFDLNEAFVIQSILAIVSPSSLLKLVDKLPNITAQIRSSDIVVINKTDLSSDQEINRTEQTIRRLNPEAEIIRSEYCTFDFTLGSRSHPLPDKDLSTVEANPYTTETIPLLQSIRLKDLEAWLDQLPPSILRVKGNVLTDQGWLRLEKSYDSTELTPTEQADTSSLVMIVQDEDVFALERHSQSLIALLHG